MKIKVPNVFVFFKEGLIKTVMRAFIFLWCTNVFCISTNSTFAQVNVIIEKNQTVTIFQVFKIIKQQTDLNFIYPRKVFKDIPDVELKKGTIAVSKLLGQCLSANNLDFEVTEDNTILIKEKAVVVYKEVQQKTITGKITDASGQPIPGVNIIEKGTTNGVQSDFDGKFSLKLKSEKAILVLSYMGFKTKEISVSGQTNLTIKLEEDSAKLEEVVVVGYGSVKKKDLTGAIVSVGAEKLEGRSNSNVLQSLAGQATGVQITQSQGAPDLLLL